MLLQRSTGYGSDKNRQQMAKKLIKDIDNNLKYKKSLYGDEILYNGGVLAKLLEFDLKMESKKNRNKKKI